MSDKFFEPPPEMEAFVLAAFDDFRRRRKHRRWGGVCLLTAAAVGLAILIHGSPVRRPSETQRPLVRINGAEPIPAVVTARAKSPRKRHRRKIAVVAVDPGPDFIPIPYTAPILPGERVSVIRTEMPVAALVAAGVPLFGSDAGASAQAELIVGEDGVARAVRVIAVAEYRENR